MTIRTATGLIAAYMRACKFDGWASFWRVIYVLPGLEHNQRLLRHERKIRFRDAVIEKTLGSLVWFSYFYLFAGFIFLSQWVTHVRKLLIHFRYPPRYL